MRQTFFEVSEVFSLSEYKWGCPHDGEYYSSRILLPELFFACAHNQDLGSHIMSVSTSFLKDL